MDDRRTEFEKELTVIVYEIEHFFDKRVVLPGDYMDIRGKIKNLRAYLDNKTFGCPTGKHRGDCFKIKH